MRKIIITILIFIMIAPIPASVFAGEKKWQREENRPNKIKINGECNGRDVAIQLFSQNSGEPVYSAGAECKNGRFGFKDDLTSWNIPDGAYLLMVGQDDSREEVVVERNSSFNSQPSSAVMPEEPSSLLNLETSGGSTSDGFASVINSVDDVYEGQNQNTIQENNEDSGFISRITQIVKSVLASLGLFIENGIAKLEELTARKIVIGEAEIEEARIKNAKIQNLEVSEKIQLRDQTTDETYCTWVENGEWVKVKSTCLETVASGMAEEVPAIESSAVEPTADEPAAVEPVTVEASAVENPNASEENSATGASVVEPPAVEESSAEVEPVEVEPSI